MGTWWRSGALVCAGVVLSSCVLAGCTDEPPEPSTIDDTKPASKEPSAAPTPTSTLSTEEQQAYDAAVTAYERWIDVVAEIYTAPEDYTASEIVTEVRKVGGDPLAGQMLSVLRSAKELGRVQRGEQQTEEISLEGVTTDVSEGNYPEVLLRVCADTSGLDLIDLESGESLLPEDQQTKWVSHVKVWYYEDDWHVVEDETRSEEERC